MMFCVHKMGSRRSVAHTGGDCFLPGEIVLDITDSDLFLPETASVFYRYLPGSGAVQREYLYLESEIWVEERMTG
jgi:hypothetical protein